LPGETKIGSEYAKETARRIFRPIRVLKDIENVPAGMDPEGSAAPLVRTALVKMAFVPEIIGAGEKVRSAAYRAAEFFDGFHGFPSGRIYPVVFSDFSMNPATGYSSIRETWYDHLMISLSMICISIVAGIPRLIRREITLIPEPGG
jgi:hypothetical protein